MTSENKPASSGGVAAWVGIISALAAAAVLFGLNSDGDVDVFGINVPIIAVGLVLWLLGYLSGMFSRRRQG